MPADLTAAEIIALLRERQWCCKSLDITVTISDIVEQAASADGVATWRYPSIENADVSVKATRFRRWLTGACVEKLDELGIDVVRANSSGSEWYFGPRNRCIESDVQLYPTFLHAATAAIEAHCKETT